MSEKTFPSYSHKRKIGDKGVSFVRAIVEIEFDWIFRPTHLEEDFGVDGYFDVIGFDNSVTGKYLGVQVKTGQSYFDHKTSFGWTFFGESKHLNYFSNLDFPVLIILVNLEEQHAFWVEFDLNKTSKSKNGWSIVVPKANVFDGKIQKTLLELVGGVIDYMPQIEYHWELSEKIKGSYLTLIGVSKEEIQAKDVRGFILLLEKLTINDDMIQKARGKISFAIEDYDDDPREVYEIEEVREWVKLVIPAFKYWVYFLNMEPFLVKAAGLRILHLCLVEIEIVSNDRELRMLSIDPNKEQTIEFLRQLTDWQNEFANKYQIPESIAREQFASVVKILFSIDKLPDPDPKAI